MMILVELLIFIINLLKFSFMKKLLMSVILVAAVAAGYMMTGSNESEVNVSDLAKANVEALAQHVEVAFVIMALD